MNIAKIQVVSASLGVVALVACVLINAVVGARATGAGSADCNSVMSQLLNAPPSQTDIAGAVRIVKVWPPKVALNRDICILVGGAGAATGVQVPPAQASFHLVMSGVVVPEREITLNAIPGPQVVQVSLSVPNKADGSTDNFWRDLLRGVGIPGAGGWGTKDITLGLSSGGAALPVAGSTQILTIVAFNPLALAAGGLALLAFAVAFICLALRTSILRDGPLTFGDGSYALAIAKSAADKAKAVEAELSARVDQATAAAAAAKLAADASPADAVLQAALAAAGTDVTAAQKALEAQKVTVSAALDAVSGLEADRSTLPPKSGETPIAPFSLARSQMALWLILTTAGFLYIWLGIGQYWNVVTGQTLTLLGIQAITGVAAVQIDGNKGPTSRSFLRDILGDTGSGPRLDRIQAVAWTAVLATIFTWNVLWNFRFVEFDTNLLILLGIAQGVYLGFKYQG